MRAITLWQPYASAIALGIKRVETRSPWAMRLRSMIGEDLAITAAARHPVLDPVDGYKVHRRPDGSWWAEHYAAGTPPFAGPDELALPLGCVVAVVRIRAVVQVYAPPSGTGIIPPDLAMIDPGPEHGLRWTEPLAHARHGWQLHHVEDQRPWGDFTPGRTAIVLEDVRRMDTPVACRGLQQLWTLPDDVATAVSRQLHPGYHAMADQHDEARPR